MRVLLKQIIFRNLRLVSARHCARKPAHAGSMKSLLQQKQMNSVSLKMLMNRDMPVPALPR